MQVRKQQLEPDMKQQIGSKLEKEEVKAVHCHPASVQFCSVTQLCPTLPPHGLQHARPPCPSPTLGACSNSCPSSQWCHPTISSSVIPFSSCLQSFLASGSFQMSRFLASGGQSIGVSASASVLPMNIQDCFPLGWTGLISLQAKGLSRVFSNTTVQKHQFFSTQLSLLPNSHICTWLLEKIFQGILPDGSPNWHSNFRSHQKKSSLWSMAIFGIIRHYFCHYKRWNILSRCFILHCPDIWPWAFFRIFIYYLYIYLSIFESGCIEFFVYFE